MEISIIRTIITFTISDDPSRDDIIDLLEGLGFVDGNDQSTMVNTHYIPTTTLNTINEYCKTENHGLDEDDTISIYYSSYIKDKNGEITSYIVKKDYNYDPDRDAFI